MTEATIAEPQTTAELAQRFIDALHRLERDNELNPIVNSFSVDAIIANAALDLTNPVLRGSDRVRQFWRDYRGLFAQASSEFHQITVAEQAAGLFCIARGKVMNDVPFEYQGASLLVFELTV